MSLFDCPECGEPVEEYFDTTDSVRTFLPCFHHITVEHRGGGFNWGGGGDFDT